MLRTDFNSLIAAAVLLLGAVGVDLWRAKSRAEALAAEAQEWRVLGRESLDLPPHDDALAVHLLSLSSGPAPTAASLRAVDLVGRIGPVAAPRRLLALAAVGTSSLLGAPAPDPTRWEEEVQTAVASLATLRDAMEAACETCAPPPGGALSTWRDEPRLATAAARAERAPSSEASSPLVALMLEARRGEVDLKAAAATRGGLGLVALELGRLGEPGCEQLERLMPENASDELALHYALQECTRSRTARLGAPG